MLREGRVMRRGPHEGEEEEEERVRHRWRRSGDYLLEK